MIKEIVSFSHQETAFIQQVDFSFLRDQAAGRKVVLITDSNVFEHYAGVFEGYKTIVFPAGEENKHGETVNKIIEKLIKYEVDRSYLMVGVGGGVVTDVTGYVASVFLRGVEFGFIPTSLLGLVDASIGGKNGIDFGRYKNMIGTINQPEFLLQDLSFLKTLPLLHWQNGFAEIIKHACILDAEMFEELRQNDVAYYQNAPDALERLVTKNMSLKLAVVQRDEFELAERKCLNYGHTLGHAVENTYDLLHGQAIAYGMLFANFLSEKLLGFNDSANVEELLKSYGLWQDLNIDVEEVFQYFLMDKKRKGNQIQFVLLTAIGQAKIHKIELDILKEMLHDFVRKSKLYGSGN